MGTSGDSVSVVSKRQGINAMKGLGELVIYHLLLLNGFLVPY